MTVDGFDVKAAVALGVVFFDRNHPGWDELVPLRDLDMRSACGCVVGHVEGNFWDGIRSLDLSLEDAARLGLFVLTGELGSAEAGRRYDALQEEWIRVIRERRDTSLYSMEDL